ncbi:MAG: hypothetical protein DIU69_01475 [Bacillota bacterium]|nr:MAG: hypothetical protein DIU69_01475 [Bacillota bacterium]
MRPETRGELLQPNGLRVLAELGILNRLLASGAQVIHTIEFYQRSGDPLGTLDYRLLDPPYDYVVGNRPHRLRQLLLQSLGDTPIWWHAKVEGLQRDGNTWRVAVSTPAGPQQVRSRIVVAADGARSQVRRMLGIRARVRTYRDAYALTIVPRPADFPAVVRQYQGGGTLLGLVPVHPDELYVYWSVPAHRRDEFKGLGSGPLLQALDREDPGLARSLSSLPAVAWTVVVPVRVDAETWVVDGGVLLGDAAHALNPNAAQGTNQALADARALAPVLAAALGKGRVDAASLAPYEHARRALAAGAQRAGEEAARLWTSANPLTAWMAARVIRNLKHHPELARKLVTLTAGLEAAPFTLAERLRLII